MRKGKEVKYEMRYVENYGEIGAGRIHTFPAERVKRVPVPVPVGAPEDHIGTLTVRGKSLTDEGFRDGDQIVVNRDFRLSDLTPDTVCAVFLRSTGEPHAKKIARGPVKGMITLRSSGGGEPDMHVEEEDVEIQGIAYAMLRFADERGRFSSRPADDDIPF
jgi:SOS-response transcriptional repressor LexA